MTDQPAHSSNRAARAATIVIGLGAWLMVLGYGFHRMMAYSLKPGEKSATTASTWPAKLPFEPSKTKDTLVLTLHPECPCSMATVSELERILAAKPDLTVFAVFEDYETLPGKVEDSRLWKETTRIPGVSAIVDKSGSIAGIIGSHTSGEVHLFNPRGDLLYHGGITGSRGHAGANPGSDAVLALISGESASPHLEGPTFGCSLDRSN
jgi:hypothetical protein